MDVPLKRLGYYRKERERFVVAGVGEIVDFGEWNNFGVFERSFKDVLLDTEVACIRQRYQNMSWAILSR